MKQKISLVYYQKTVTTWKRLCYISTYEKGARAGNRWGWGLINIGASVSWLQIRESKHDYNTDALKLSGGFFYCRCTTLLFWNKTEHEFHYKTSFKIDLKWSLSTVIKSEKFAVWLHPDIQDANELGETFKRNLCWYFLFCTGAVDHLAKKYMKPLR